MRQSRPPTSIAATKTTSSAFKDPLPSRTADPLDLSVKRLSDISEDSSFNGFIGGGESPLHSVVVDRVTPSADCIIRELVRDSTEGLRYYRKPLSGVETNQDLRRVFPAIKTPAWCSSANEATKGAANNGGGKLWVRAGSVLK